MSQPAFLLRQTAVDSVSVSTAKRNSRAWENGWRTPLWLPFLEFTKKKESRRERENKKLYLHYDERGRRTLGLNSNICCVEDGVCLLCSRSKHMCTWWRVLINLLHGRAHSYPAERLLARQRRPVAGSCLAPLMNKGREREEWEREKRGKEDERERKEREKGWEREKDQEKTLTQTYIYTDQHKDRPNKQNKTNNKKGKARLQYLLTFCSPAIPKGRAADVITTCSWNTFCVRGCYGLLFISLYRGFKLFYMEFGRLRFSNDYEMQKKSVNRFITVVSLFHFIGPFSY